MYLMGYCSIGYSVVAMQGGMEIHSSTTCWVFPQISWCRRNPLFRTSICPSMLLFNSL